MKLLSKLKKIATAFRGRPEMAFPVEATSQDIECLEFCLPFTMTSVARLYATLSAVKYIVNNDISGDMVECGVWRGGNSMVIAKTLLGFADFDREIYLFDTFEGMTSPTHMDLDQWGDSAEAQLNECPKSKDNHIWCLASEDDVAANLFSTGYPAHKIHLVKGDVTNTLDEESNLPEIISLLRLDTDWYESTKKTSGSFPPTGQGWSVPYR